MYPRTDLVALSILPVWRWRAVAEQLRQGLSPSDILLSQCADGVRGRPRPPAWSDPAWALDRARQAVARAELAGVRALVLGDAAYPAPLSHIVDPPPVIWIIGSDGALDSVSVAIVGSRAGSSY